MTLKLLIKNTFFVIAVTLLFCACTINDTNKSVSNFKNKYGDKIKLDQIDLSSAYSYDEYVNLLSKINISKEFPDINNIPD